jgi:glycosyltransferase involved in cell wall biosynthesis
VERSSLGIVIPAFNEARTIANVVALCNVYGRSIVVDDGSNDDTGDVADASGAEVIRHAGNRGYDAALESGFQHAAHLGCEYVITIDADGQHDPALLAKFCALLDAGADIVIGNRNERPRLAETCFALLTQFRYGLKDPLCGLKAYRMSIYEKLGHFDSYNSIGTELMLYAIRNGFRMQQVPIVVKSRVDKPRFGNRLRANYKIFRAMYLSLSNFNG